MKLNAMKTTNDLNSIFSLEVKEEMAHLEKLVKKRRKRIIKLKIET